MSKQKFYNLSNLLKTESQYKMLLGERSNGKSYAVKEYVLNEAYKNNNQFAYIRRWRRYKKRKCRIVFFRYEYSKNNKRRI